MPDRPRSREVTKEPVMHRAGRGSDNYCVYQRAACAVSVSGDLRQRRAASISASLAPWLRAHISAAEAEYFAT